MLEYRTVVCHPFAWVCLFCWLGVHLCRYAIPLRESAFSVDLVYVCAGMLSLSVSLPILLTWFVPVCYYFAWVCSFCWLGVRLCRSAITLRESARSVDSVYVCAGMLSLCVSLLFYHFTMITRLYYAVALVGNANHRVLAFYKAYTLARYHYLIT